MSDIVQAAGDELANKIDTAPAFGGNRDYKIISK